MCIWYDVYLLRMCVHISYIYIYRFSKFSFHVDKPVCMHIWTVETNKKGQFLKSAAMCRVY